MDPMGTIVTVLISACFDASTNVHTQLFQRFFGDPPGAWYSQSRGQSTIECVEVPNVRHPTSGKVTL